VTAAAQVLNRQISIVRLSQMFVDSDTIADIQLEGAMLFLVFAAACCVRRVLLSRDCVAAALTTALGRCSSTCCSS
jgi:hypothetical protein